MIATPATAISSTTTTDQSSSTKKKSDLGQQEFMTLLLAQLKNQDPMNPMDNADFTAQMAQFSSLEQLVNVNENLGALTTAANATNTAQAMGLIGKEVKAAGENVHVKNGTASSIAFELPDSASSVIITVEDQYGNVVRTIEQSTMSAGPHQIEWDGMGTDGKQLADGLYKYSVIAKDTEGNMIEADTFTKGIVDKVSFDNGVGYVHIGDLKYMLNEILEVSEPTQSSTSANTAPQSGLANLFGTVDSLI